jgi:hypothetical protein
MPYAVSIVCAIISGISSYVAACRQGKNELKKLQKSHELELETERERHKMEMDRAERDFEHKLELQKNDFENQMGASFLTTVVGEAMKTPEVRKQMIQGMKNTQRKKK